MKTEKDEKKLKIFYEMYVDIPLYRVVPKISLNKIKKQGINPKKDPYEKIKPKILQFTRLINKFEKRGKIIELDWGRTVYGSYVMADS